MFDTKRPINIAQQIDISIPPKKIDPTEGGGVIAPEVEILEFAVENGFINSLQDPFENDEMDW